MDVTMKIVLIFTIVNQSVIQAKDVVTIGFVQKFIVNEQKPTYLIYADLCWNKYYQMTLTSYVSKSGFRSTASFGVDFKYQDHGLLFLLDLSCPKFGEVIANATLRDLFGYPYRWLILADSEEKLSELVDVPILADSDVVLAERTEYGYKITEIHKPSNTSTLVYTPRGFYNGSLYDTRPYRQLFWRRRDVKSVPITIANVIQDSNSTQYHLPREDRLELQYDVVTKACWMNVKLAFEMLNATPRYIFSHRWGYKQDGQWSGMINDLHVYNADLGTNCLVSDPERLDVVTYTDMLAPFRVRFVFRQPPLSYVTNIFSLPFSTSVWVAIAVCAGVSTLALFVATRWEAKYGRSPTQLDGGIGDALLLTMSAVSQQGCQLEPRRMPGRITVWILFLVLMALYAAYSAHVVALLQAPSSALRTLAHLAGSKLTLAANDVDYNHYVFSLYKDPVRVAIYKRVDPEKGRGQFYDMNEGVERIRRGLFAFHSIVEPVYRRIEQTFHEAEKCDLAEVDFLNSFDTFVPVRKRSPYLELLRVAFKRIREAGLQSAITQRTQTPKPRCASRQAAFSSVGLADLRPVLLLMLYGTALSVAIMLGEMLVAKLSKQAKWRSPPEPTI